MFIPAIALVFTSFPPYSMPGIPTYSHKLGIVKYLSLVFFFVFNDLLVHEPDI
jgi:hypothetical protein